MNSEENRNEEETEEGNQRWEMDKNLKAANYSGAIVYKMRLQNREDGRSKTKWVPCESEAEDERKAFHIKYTFSGKVRKCPLLRI